MIPFEVFAASNLPPDEVWAVVGNPRRLPEWTDADRVERVEPEPVDVGSVIVTRDGDRALHWEVVTYANRTIEVVADTPRGRLGLGARVVRDGTGSRIVLAGVLGPSGSAVAARIFHVPALRRRFDRWSQAALELARAR